MTIRVLFLLLLAASASAQLTKGEAGCQQAASKQLGALTLKRIKCLVACDKQALKGKVPATDCLPPYAGTTLACVGKVLDKALAGIAKGCAADCPECYAAGDCGAYASALSSDVNAAVDAVVPIVRCDDSASPDGLTKAEAKVRQKVAGVVGKFTSGYEKCYAKCRKKEAAGKVPAGACVPEAETDQKTIDCLTKAALKAFDYLEDPALDAPECLAPELAFALTIAAGRVVEFDPLLFCASPSGAFL